MTQVQVKKQEQEKTPERRSQGRSGEFLPSIFPFGPGQLMATTPFTLMRHFADEMDRVFSGLWRRGAEDEEIAASWWPPMEVSTDHGTLTVSLDLPGTKPRDVKVEVTDHSLIISGERKQEREEKAKDFYRSERHYGNFCRSIPLPEGADTAKASAEFVNGELRVSIPVPEAATARHEIPVKSG